MPPRHNPLKLNPLQLRTLTLLQALAHVPGAAARTPAGDLSITKLPQPHGDHFHLGEWVVDSRNATGLTNEAVWNALARKGLARAAWPHQVALTPAGLGYETGLKDEILRLGGH